MKKFFKEKKVYDIFYSKSTRNIPLKVTVYNTIVEELVDSDESFDLSPRKGGPVQNKAIKKKLTAIN